MNTLPDPKKIGIDARLWRETGVGRYIRNLIGELQKIDKENEYVLLVRSQDVSNVQSSIINDQFSIRIVDVKWHTLEEQLQLPKILEKENLDLVHFPYFSVPIRYKGAYVLTIHDLILHHFSTGKASTHPLFIYWLKLQGYRYIISQATKNAEKIITVSQTTKKEIIQHLHIAENKISVTYEGIDTKITNSSFQFQNKDAKYQIQNTKYFLYVGNAYPHKNLERLLEAFGQVKREMVNIKDLKLILVGKEDYFYKRLEGKVKRMDLEDSIVFLHTVTDIELGEYYAHALALVVPSRMEGFGLPILEAMKNECLVVASDISVFHEIARDIPLYFSPTDTNALKNVLESIVQGRIKDAGKRKKEGKKQTEKFSWEKMAQETLAVYKGCFRV